MRHYKADLNPLLSPSLGEKGDQIMRIAAYQDFRIKVGAWLRGSQTLGAAKCKRRSTEEEIQKLKKEATGKFADALISTLDFQSSWKETHASEIASAIFYHIADWSDEVFASESPMPRSLGKRDIAEELSEASTDLHLAVCEEIGIIDSEQGPI